MTALLALSPVTVATARTVGPDAWALLLAACAMYSGALALRHNRHAAWIALLVTFVLLAAVSPSALALVPAQTICLLAENGATRRRGSLYLALTTMIVVAGFIAVPFSTSIHFAAASPWSWLADRDIAPLASGAATNVLALLGLVPAAFIAASASGERRDRMVIAWLIAFAGVLGFEAWHGGRFEPPEMAVAELFVALGVANAGRLAAQSGALQKRPYVTAAVGVVGFGVVCSPALYRQRQELSINWHELVATVRANIAADESIVVFLERDTFLLYAPDLASRVKDQLPPARAFAYSNMFERAWFVVPWQTRLYPAWPKIRKWVEQFNVLDLTPTSGANLYYFVDQGRQRALLRASMFDLPVTSLVRGTLLQEMVRDQGPSAAVLWKIDQVALWRRPQLDRNPSLLATVALLVERGFADRAAALVYRLATADRGWTQAQEMLAAFR
jgi:hypothetical protein